MENQIPAPSFPEQNNANSPQPVPAGVAPGAPLGAAPAPALGMAPANVRDRDDSYQRIPDIYRVPAEHRRPYGETTGDFRGPGYSTRGFRSRHSTLRQRPGPAITAPLLIAPA